MKDLSHEIFASIADPGTLLQIRQLQVISIADILKCLESLDLEGPASSEKFMQCDAQREPVGGSAMDMEGLIDFWSLNK